MKTKRSSKKGQGPIQAIRQAHKNEDLRIIKETGEPQNVYFYNLTYNTGKPQVRKRKGAILHYSKHETFFISYAEDEYRFRCGPDEGDPFRSTVWFREPNDDEALIVFAFDLQSKIAEYESKMDNLLIAINYLENSMYRKDGIECAQS